jgi:hypothetical protein
MRDPILQISITITTATVAEADQLFKTIKNKLATVPNCKISGNISAKPADT